MSTLIETFFIQVHLEISYFNWDFVVVVRLIVGHLHRGVPPPEQESIKKWDENTLKIWQMSDFKYIAKRVIKK